MINATDGYKVDHRSQYPKGTSLVMSNWTPRGTRTPFEGIVLFGLQYFILKYLMEEWNSNFFSVEEDVAVKAYKRRIDHYLPNHNITFEHIRDLHNLGYLPIQIDSLPEGTVTPVRVPMFTIRNTKPEFFWVTNYLEPLLSCTMWPMCTSATTAYEYRKLLDSWAKKTGGDLGFVPFQGHDFSFRGMFGYEAASMSGAAHLTSFMGTDSLPSIDLLEEYYEANCEKETIGVSVPATEHSVMCMGGSTDEIGTFRRIINEVYPKGIVSIVSDTWDFWKVMTEYLPILKDEIMSRDGKVVIRPDSGDPVDIVCGTGGTPLGNGKYRVFDGDLNTAWVDVFEWVDVSEHECKGAIEILWDIFGGTINEQGYKVLDPHIGLIYGDAITYDRANQISKRLADKGFASTNIVYGIGSFTYQGAVFYPDAVVTRDTHGFAIKATYGEIHTPNEDGTLTFSEENKTIHEIYKDPATDSGEKKSARGLVNVFEQDGKLVMKDRLTWDEYNSGLMQPVFRDGELLKTVTLSEIRDRLNS